jgi:hypothetical protein
MEATVGDRVSLDAKKVGQTRRGGVVLDVSQGLAGVRYQIRWDDGHESSISPGAGVLIVEGRAGNGKKASKGSKKSSRKSSKAGRK